MMYQEGHVDMLALKEILGHAHVSTTEIYTHLGSAQLKEAAKASPFAKMDFERRLPALEKRRNDGKSRRYRHKKIKKKRAAGQQF